MNKSEFLKVLRDKLKCTQEEAEGINNIFEETFIIGKKNKEKIITKLINVLHKSESDAENIYNTVSEIITTSIKESLKHPFKSKD